MSIPLNDLSENSTNSVELELYIDKYFQDLYDFFHNQNRVDLYEYRDEIKHYIKSSHKVIVSLNIEKSINSDFIALFIEVCAKLHLLVEFSIFYDHLSKTGYKIGKRLESMALYCKNIKKFDDYSNRVFQILDFLNEAYVDEDEDSVSLTITFIDFYLKVVYDFGEYNKENVFKLKESIQNYYVEKNFTFLDDDFVDIVFSISLNNYNKACTEIELILNNYLITNNRITCQFDDVQIEVGNYSEELQKIENPDFDNILQISYDYIRTNVQNERELHGSLNRGTKIIDSEIELFQYIKSFGVMHKRKLYDSYDQVIHLLNNETINVIDWGCGQALATSILIDYIQENELAINLQQIILIEPSDIALSRGLLHINILEKNQPQIRAVNKDIDCLVNNDLIIDNGLTTLHLFSNILDVEYFKLDKQFLEKISTTQTNQNYFICVSPNINDKRNARIDLFYKYFHDHFNTILLSSRNNNIGHYSRYEKIFKVNL